MYYICIIKWVCSEQKQYYNFIDTSSVCFLYLCLYLNDHLKISKKSLLSVFTEVLVKEHPFLLGIILILSRILPGCQTYSVFRSKISYFRQKSTNERRSVCAHVWRQEGAGRGRVRVTIMMVFRFIWVHFLSLLLLYLNITPPHFFPDQPLLYSSDLYNKCEANEEEM